MIINWLNIIQFLLSIILFVWAIIERSKRMPLWWTLKGLEQAAMSNLSLYNDFIKKYESEDRKEIPLEEIIVQLDNSFGHWNSHWELIRGIRYSINTKIAEKEEKFKKKPNHSVETTAKAVR